MKKVILNNIDTEKRNKNSRDIDTKSFLEIVNIINYEDSKIANAVKLKLAKIAEAAELCYKTIRNGGRVFYIGAGTSGRLGVLDASEMLPTFGSKNDFIGLIAGGENALKNPIEGAEDFEEYAVEDLKKENFSIKDIVFAIGASGRTPYCIGGLKYAKKIGSLSIALSMTNSSEFSKFADTNIEVITGPEVVTGSTRMKAGTATKMVLNLISTTVMIKLGKVYDNLMIDVKATNEKLLSRAQMIIREITAASDQDIENALTETNMDVKKSIVMIVNKVSAENATKILNSNDDDIRKSLKI